jgi:potassium-transporting ATPase ATP-binding subunit
MTPPLIAPTPDAAIVQTAPATQGTAAPAPTGRERRERAARASMYRSAVIDSFRKLDPRTMVGNPVMFVVEVASVLTTILGVQALLATGEAPAGFIVGVAALLWTTVLFANFSQALAEGRGKARAEALRRTRQLTEAKRVGAGWELCAERCPIDDVTLVPSTELRRGDLFLVETGDVVPADGEVVSGIAMVNESAVTGESAPVVRESGGDRSAVTGGTRVLSDWIVVSVTADPGQGFLDRMIGLVEGARRQKTPNEIALTILLAGFTIMFLVV